MQDHMQNFSQIGEVPWSTLTQILQSMPLNRPVDWPVDCSISQVPTAFSGVDHGKGKRAEIQAMIVIQCLENKH